MQVSRHAQKEKLLNTHLSAGKHKSANSNRHLVSYPCVNMYLRGEMCGVHI